MVRWGTTRIPYVVRRSARRTTVSIAVAQAGDVILAAPYKATIGRLDELVLAKAKWIVERVRRKSERPAPGMREYLSGETFLYLGRQHRLRVEREQAGQVGLIRGWLVVPVPSALERLVVYVVAHELCHIEHPDHTPAFWAKLGSVMPDHDARRDALPDLGPRLTW